MTELSNGTGNTGSPAERAVDKLPEGADRDDLTRLLGDEWQEWFSYEHEDEAGEAS